MEDEKQKTQPQEEKTDLQKLKEANDEFEKELIKAREMRAERQKIEAERLLGSTAGQPIPPQVPKIETAKEYADKVMKGEVKPKSL